MTALVMPRRGLTCGRGALRPALRPAAVALGALRLWRRLRDDGGLRGVRAPVSAMLALRGGFGPRRLGRGDLGLAPASPFGGRLGARGPRSFATDVLQRPPIGWGRRDLRVSPVAAVVAALALGRLAWRPSRRIATEVLNWPRVGGGHLYAVGSPAAAVLALTLRLDLGLPHRVRSPLDATLADAVADALAALFTPPRR